MASRSIPPKCRRWLIFWSACGPQGPGPPAPPIRRSLRGNERAMSPTHDAFLRSWPFAPWLATVLACSAVVYAVGWRELRARDPIRWHAGRMAAFLAGLATIYLALASPLEPFAP